MKAFVDKLIALGPLGLFLLAFLDGVGVPLPGGVDSLLVILCATDPSRAYLYALVTVVASIAGGVLLFVLARKGGEKILEKHTARGRGARFKIWFLSYGLITIFIPAIFIIPMPLKVFVVCAGAMGIPLRSYVITILLARIPRYFALAWLGANYGRDAWPWIKSHGWHMTGFAVALFAVIYLVASRIKPPLESE
jgi:membrane protein YqaA with SNARE-associated domain